MIYFKNDENTVFAYPKEDIAQTERLTELELILQEREPVFILAAAQLQQKKSSLDELIVQLENSINSDDVSEDDIKQLEGQINTVTTERDLASVEFSEIESEYRPLKDEYDAILSVFFEIRENLNVMKKMTAKEVNAHINPPMSKEQLITDAEQQKQSLLSEAAEAIAPLQDAVDLEIVMEEETIKLKEWKTYRVMLNRINTSTAPDIEWPIKPI